MRKRENVLRMFDAYARDTPDALGFGDWLLEVYLPLFQGDALATHIALEDALIDSAMAYFDARTAKMEWQKANQPEYDSETPEELEHAIGHAHVLMMIVASELRNKGVRRND
jgi:hypothetical protein